MRLAVRGLLLGGAVAEEPARRKPWADKKAGGGLVPFPLTNKKTNQQPKPKPTKTITNNRHLPVVLPRERRHQRLLRRRRPPRGQRGPRGRQKVKKHKTLCARARRFCFSPSRYMRGSAFLSGDLIALLNIKKPPHPPVLGALLLLGALNDASARSMRERERGRRDAGARNLRREPGASCVAPGAPSPSAAMLLARASRPLLAPCSRIAPCPLSLSVDCVILKRR